MEFLIGLFVGIIVTGLVCYLVMNHRKPSGSFVMDFSDPMKDVCRLELDESLDNIYKKKTIILKIKTISQ